MNVWFSSDTHFNHRSMVEKGWRPQYSSVSEMNEDIIQRWNSVVREDDTVWHLGDFALGNVQEALQIVYKLNGNIHLVTGNHDVVWPGNRDSHKHQAYWMNYFASVQSFARRKIAGKYVLLSHFPYSGDHVDGEERYEGYRLRDTGLHLLCGHVHDEWRIKDRQFNVGVDVNNMTPVSMREVEQWVSG